MDNLDKIQRVLRLIGDYDFRTMEDRKLRLLEICDYLVVETSPEYFGLVTIVDGKRTLHYTVDDCIRWIVSNVTNKLLINPAIQQIDNEG